MIVYSGAVASRNTECNHILATYTKRGGSYHIRASAGYTPEDKQVMKSRTWMPEPGMTPRYNPLMLNTDQSKNL